MAEAPLYPQVVVGYVENERGEDARLLGERIAERDGGELKVVHVEKDPPPTLSKHSPREATPI